MYDPNDWCVCTRQLSILGPTNLCMLSTHKSPYGNNLLATPKNPTTRSYLPSIEKRNPRISESQLQSTLYKEIPIFKESQLVLHYYINTEPSLPWGMWNFLVSHYWVLGDSFITDLIFGRSLAYTPLVLSIRDGNLDPTRGYPVRSDPNGPDFTRSDKE